MFDEEELARAIEISLIMNQESERTSQEDGDFCAELLSIQVNDDEALDIAFALSLDDKVHTQTTVDQPSEDSEFFNISSSFEDTEDVDAAFEQFLRDSEETDFSVYVGGDQDCDEESEMLRWLDESFEDLDDIIPSPADDYYYRQAGGGPAPNVNYY